ncbi:MAG: HAMP domain-containing protein [Persephonella sp.]|nr:HAMP domain-containing protein [Persephonella sp.]
MFLDKLLLFFPIRVVFPVFALIIFLITGIYSGWSELIESKKEIEQGKLEYLCKTAAELQELAEFSAWKKNLELIERKIINESADPFIDVIFVAAPSGKLIISSKRKYIGENYVEVIRKNLPHSHKEVLSFIKSFEKKAGLVCSHIERENVVIAASPIIFYQKDLRTTSTGFLYMQYNVEKLEEIYKQHIVLKVLQQYGFFILMFALLYIGFNKMIGERIDTIVRATQDIVRGNMDVRIHIRGRDEFAVIASVINNLVDKLNRYISYDYLTGILNRFGLENR